MLDVFIHRLMISSCVTLCGRLRILNHKVKYLNSSGSDNGNLGGQSLLKLDSAQPLKKNFFYYFKYDNSV